MQQATIIQNRHQQQGRIINPAGDLTHATKLIGRKHLVSLMERGINKRPCCRWISSQGSSTVDAIQIEILEV